MQEDLQNQILEQYRIYNESKEKYIDRNFATNRYYMSFCVFILGFTYLLCVFSPDSLVIFLTSFLGMFLSILWWLNVDAYNRSICIKYREVLEVMEESLPKQPFKTEFAAMEKARKKTMKFSFGDVQKLLASFLFLSFFLITIVQILTYLKSVSAAV